MILLNRCTPYTAVATLVRDHTAYMSVYRKPKSSLILLIRDHSSLLLLSLAFGSEPASCARRGRIPWRLKYNRVEAMEFYKKAFSAQEPTPGGQVLQPHIRCSSVLAEAGEEVRIIAASAHASQCAIPPKPSRHRTERAIDVDSCVIRG
jgi:hypothetical protein